MIDPHSFDSESEAILKLFEEIKKKPEMTQRELSSRLGVSLGKVNFLLKGLVSKGLVKASNFKNASNKNAYLYMLTPRGAEEKARITYRFLKRKIEEYERLEEEIRHLREAIEQDGRLNGRDI